MKKLTFINVLIFVLFIVSCENDNNNQKLTIDKVNGYAQKGPFLNGTAITVSELSTDLLPTGKNFTSEILDNTGTFEVNNVRLSSQYVELRANGFYFDEVQNENSSAQLSLSAISDLEAKSSLNVNILSSLEKNRVKYLFSSGKSFSEAKKQAQQEILNIFEINKNNMPESELLDISRSGDDNAILLAVSVIMQGRLSVSDLSELLANFSTDIREDGILNSQNIGSALINNATALDLSQIRQNLEEKYEAMGQQLTIPDFEKYVHLFLDSTGYMYTDTIVYPEYGTMGENILYKYKNEYETGKNTNYVVYAILPKGTKLKINCINWSGFHAQENTGWNYYLNRETGNFYLETYKTGEVEMGVKFNTDESSQAYVEYYENNETVPSFIKELIPAGQSVPVDTTQNDTIK